MIAKSDLIILTVSTTALAVGVYRWQQGSGAPSIAAAPPPPVERVVAEVPDAVIPDDVLPGDPATAVVGSLARGADDAPVAAPDSGAVRVRRVSVGGTGDAGTTDDGAASVERDAGTDPAVTLAESSPADTGEALYGSYRIRDGDYLGKLANRFGTSVATLQSINGIDGTTIHVGEELLYPLPAN